MIAACIGLLAACSEETTTTEETTDEVVAEDTNEVANNGYTTYGIADMNFDADVVAVADVASMVAQGVETAMTIEATIQEVCQKAGCWIKVGLNDTTQMRVYFKDHFTIPTETGAETCLLQGVAYYDTISVEMQQHFLEDAAAPQSEIDAITEPKFELTFEADAIAIATKE